LDACSTRIFDSICPVELTVLTTIRTVIEVIINTRSIWAITTAAAAVSMTADHHFSISDPTAAVVTYNSSATTNITTSIHLQLTVTATTTAKDVSAAFAHSTYSF
jgi:hypothetical protein